MTEKFPQTLPQELINEALKQYVSSESASNAEKRQVSKFNYVQKHGATELHMENIETAIMIHLTIESETYTTKIPTTLEEPVEIDELSFKETDLVAICLQEGFPWAEESYVAYYTATVENVEDSRVEPPILLEFCTPPREPEYTAAVMEDPIYFELKKLLPTMSPNPWEFGSITVVYENTELAEDFLPTDMEGINPSMTDSL
jgi:hypothetical protein